MSPVPDTSDANLFMSAVKVSIGGQDDRSRREQEKRRKDFSINTGYAERGCERRQRILSRSKIDFFPSVSSQVWVSLSLLLPFHSEHVE